MANISVQGGKVWTRFMIVESAYPGEFFIFLDEEHHDFQQLKNAKESIQKDRTLRPQSPNFDIKDENIGRFTAEEVKMFLNMVYSGVFRIVKGDTPTGATLK